MMDNEHEKVGFTAADLSFFALASVITNPPELSQIMPHFDRDRVPQDRILLRDELRKTVAGVHGLEIYRSHPVANKYKSHLSEDTVVMKPKILNRDITMREYI